MNLASKERLGGLFLYHDIEVLQQLQNVSGVPPHYLNPDPLPEPIATALYPSLRVANPRGTVKADWHGGTKRVGECAWSVLRGGGAARLGTARRRASTVVRRCVAWTKAWKNGRHAAEAACPRRRATVATGTASAFDRRASWDT